MVNVQHYKDKPECPYIKAMQLDVVLFTLETNNTIMHIMKPTTTLIKEQQISPEPNLTHPL